MTEGREKTNENTCDWEEILDALLEKSTTGAELTGANTKSKEKEDTLLLLELTTG